MDEDNRKMMRVNITLYDDANQDIFALLNQTKNNRTEIVRRLLEFSLNQFPKDTLNVKNILNGSFYYASHHQNRNNIDPTSDDNNVINAEKVGNIASKINF